MSQVAATLRNPGEESGQTSTAVFGASRPGFEFTDLVPPDGRTPQTSTSYRDRPFRAHELFHFNFWDHVDGRVAQGHFPDDDYEPTTSERVLWYRFEEPPVDNGVLHPLALVALCDTMPGAVGERMGPGQPIWLPPSTDLTVHLVGDTHAEWVLARNRARHAGDGYVSVEIELWDPVGGLLAYGTQVMFLTFPDGPPPPELRRPPAPAR